MWSVAPPETDRTRRLSPVVLPSLSASMLALAAGKWGGTMYTPHSVGRRCHVEYNIYLRVSSRATREKRDSI